MGSSESTSVSKDIQSSVLNESMTSVMTSMVNTAVNNSKTTAVGKNDLNISSKFGKVEGDFFGIF